jgi:catechol 2,3-dioxygenase-like lactoylglutathione lyase family enzyme
MLAKSRVVYLFLYVKDLAASRDFYEDALGLRVIEEDSDSVKYDAGEIILGLNKAEDYGITLSTPPDHSTDIVFLVDDIDAMRAALEERGVVFSATSRYEVGAIADFYDPDGHWFTLYEPSEEAMAWPSGEKIRTVWNTNGKGASGESIPSVVLGGSNGREKRELRLDGKAIIYLFLFVQDASETFKFYHDGLGLLDLEGGPCSRASSADEEGVIKYDGGGSCLHPITLMRNAR